MKRLFIMVVLAVVTSPLMAGGSFPSDGDRWTEDANYLASWSYVQYDEPLYYVSDGDAKVGQSYVRLPSLYQWIVERFPNVPNWPGAYISFPGGPIDMSDPNTVISFWFKPELAGTTASSVQGNTMINVEFRLYTDPVGVYVDKYKSKVMLYIPDNQWRHYVLSAADFIDTPPGTPYNVSHVYGFFFMGINYSGDSSLLIDGLSISNGFPTFVMQSPVLDANSVFTTPGGVDSIELLWSTPVQFNEVGGVTVKDEHNNTIYCTAFGSGSKVMKVVFDVPLMYNKYTITVTDKVKSAITNRAIDGDGNGTAGGNAVFTIEHRKVEDISKDNQVELKDLKVLANQWLEQF